MDIPIHDQILWHACSLASQTPGLEADPRNHFPLMARGSWINDTNQSSVITNLARGPVDQGVRVFLRELWKHHAADLVRRMQSPDSPIEARNAATAARQALDASGMEIDGFGSYDPLDHLDVIKEDTAEAEADFARQHPLRRSTTIDRTAKHVHHSLHLATTDSAKRLEWSSISALGKALHTVADFYAHSNYVELLLWSIRESLPPAAVDAFNQPGSFLFDEPYPRCFTPLPSSAEVASLTRSNTMFWYGPSPEDTPLVSTLFTPMDTTYSLLEMYAAHLERVDGVTMNRDALDLALSVFDVPGRPLIVSTWNLYMDAKEALQAIGQRVREWLADRLETAGQNKDANARGALEATAAVVRSFDSAEARQWARAGRMRYVAHTLERDMAAELSRDAGQPSFRLPHHSLLRKDHAMPRPDDALRFRLACILATRTSADLIRWHFSPSPTMDGAQRILDDRLRHPWLRVGSSIATREAIAQAVFSGFGGHWMSAAQATAWKEA